MILPIPDSSNLGIDSPAIFTMSILIIEDDAGDYGLLEAEFQQLRPANGGPGPRLFWAQTLVEGLILARTALPDVVLLDLSLPDSFGLATLEAVIMALPEIPIVVFTGSDDDDMAIMAFEAGAQDYLVKGQFDRYALKRALRYATVRRRMDQNLRLFHTRFGTNSSIWRTGKP